MADDGGGDDGSGGGADGGDGDSGADGSDSDREHEEYDMPVHDERLPGEEFARFTETMPQICVELVIEHDGGVLLAERTEPPADGEWFWPGRRLYKGERLAAAAHRLAREELGIEVHLGERLGVYEHFWETSAVPGGPSRHTVNVVFRATPAESAVEGGALRVELDDQHGDWRLLRAPEPDLHPYVREYLADAGVFE